MSNYTEETVLRYLWDNTFMPAIEDGSAIEIVQHVLQGFNMDELLKAVIDRDEPTFEAFCLDVLGMNSNSVFTELPEAYARWKDQHGRDQLTGHLLR